MSMLILDIVIALVIFASCPGPQVRRVHDTNASGWWVLLAFIPYAGNLIMLVWCCFKGTAGENRFGPDPLEPPGRRIRLTRPRHFCDGIVRVGASPYIPDMNAPTPRPCCSAPIPAVC